MPEPPLTSDHAERPKSSASVLSAQKPTTASADDDYLLLGDKIEEGFIIRTRQRRARGNVVPKPKRASHFATLFRIVFFGFFYLAPLWLPMVAVAYAAEQGHWLPHAIFSIVGLLVTPWFAIRFFFPMVSDMSKMLGPFGQHAQYVERKDVDEMMAFFRARFLYDVKKVTGRLHA